MIFFGAGCGLLDGVFTTTFSMHSSDVPLSDEAFRFVEPANETVGFLMGKTVRYDQSQNAKLASSQKILKIQV